MGNSKSVSPKQKDDDALRHLEAATEELRKVITVNPYENFYGKQLDESERQVHQIMQRSKSRRHLDRCQFLIRNIEDLKDMTNRHEKESNLDTGAVESSSYIAANAKTYDSQKRSRSLQRQFKEIEGESKRLVKKLNDPKLTNAQEISTLEHAVHELLNRVDELDVTNIKWAETAKTQYINSFQDYKKRTLEIKNRSNLGKKTVNSLELRPRRRASESASIKKSNKRMEFELEVAKIMSQIEIWKEECGNFKHQSNGPEYNQLRDALMKSIDTLSAHNDARYKETKDDLLKQIQNCLKTLNLKSIENSRNSLSKEGTLRDVEILQFHIDKIHHSLSKGKVRQTAKVRHTLADIHRKLDDILNGPELVKAKIVGQPEYSDVNVSRSNLVSRSTADLLYLEDSESEKERKNRNRLSLPKMPIKYQETNFSEVKTDSLRNSKSTPDFLDDKINYVDPKDLIFPERLKSQSSNLHIATPIVLQASSSKVEISKPEICSVIEKPHSKDWQELKDIEKRATALTTPIEMFSGAEDVYKDLDQKIIDLVIQLDKFQLPTNELIQKRYHIMTILQKNSKLLNLANKLIDIHHQLDALKAEVLNKDSKYVDNNLSSLYEKLQGLQIGPDPHAKLLFLQQTAATKIEDILTQGRNLEQMIGTEV